MSQANLGRPRIDVALGAHPISITGHRPLITLNHGVEQFHRPVIVLLEWHMDPSDIAVLHTMGPEACVRDLIGGPRHC